ncbi:MAG: hypothetical protein HC867_09565 [Bacteroidia bacterium]|nr:hypothetical protein [Bacteroidia bacterium]
MPAALTFFRRAGTVWALEQKIVAADRGVNDEFGYCISISGDKIISGAFRENEDAAGGNSIDDAGSAYLFSRNPGTGVWSQTQKIVAGDRLTGANYGYAVAISGDNAIAGAISEPKDGDAGNPIEGTGAAYFYKLTPNPYYSNGSSSVNTLSSWNSQRNNWGNQAFSFTNASGWVIQSGDTLSLANAQNLTLSADSIVTENSAAIIVNGTLTLGNTNFIARGTLAGNGTVSLSNSYINTGIVTPGSSAGLLSITGTYNNSTGTLGIELGGATPGTQHDVLAISSSAIMNGTLNISLINGFTPSIAQQFTIVTASDVTGTFSSVSWPAGYTGSVIYNLTNVVITFTGTLPLRLTRFEGIIQNNSNLLRWDTELEENVKHFEIEWSATGTVFSTLSILPARNLLTQSSYSFTHIQPQEEKFFIVLKWLI